MEEIYKEVVGWDNFLVSNLGNVKSKDRQEKWTYGKDRIRRGRQMKTRILRMYQAVSLKQDNRRRGITIHRLVAEAFIENPNNYPIINHIDNNRLNNRVDNLEWCTQKMNIHHAMKNNNWTRGQNHGNAKFTNEQALQIRSSSEPNLVLAKKFGVHRSAIERIRKGKTYIF